MKVSYRSIGARIREYRLERNMTQEDLAYSIGSSPSYICHIENGRKKVSLTKLVDIAEILDVTINDLVYPEMTYSLEKKRRKRHYTDEETQLIIEFLRDQIESF